MVLGGYRSFLLLVVKVRHRHVVLKFEIADNSYLSSTQCLDCSPTFDAVSFNERFSDFKA